MGENWDQPGDLLINGGDWGAGENAVTLGIWMWICPHEVHNVKAYSKFFAYMYFFIRNFCSTNDKKCQNLFFNNYFRCNFTNIYIYQWWLSKYKKLLTLGVTCLQSRLTEKVQERTANRASSKN